MNGDADLVFIGTGFRLDGEGDGGFGELRGRIIDGRSFVGKSFGGGGFLQLGDGADISGVKLADFRELLALHGLDVLKALGQAAIVIDERGVIFQDAALYLEIVDAAGERVRKRFEDKEGKRLAVVVLALEAVSLAASVLEADLGMLMCVPKNVGEKSEQASRADVVEPGSHENREDFFGDDGFANGGKWIAAGDGALAEKTPHRFAPRFCLS